MILFATTLLLSANLIDERGCAAKRPQKTTLAELYEQGARWEGRCVTVSGKYLAGALVEGADKQADGLPRLRLGLYEREGYRARMAIGTKGGVWEVTGVLDSCRRIAEQVRADYARQVQSAKSRGEIHPPPPMLSGFCHYSPGPVIWIKSFRTQVASN